ncbi:Replication factor C, subunit RFC4 [Linderina macrospora]|uniref:Replication factor C, subunit RFC4 n=1 Tax=Linderina macrospora TaxID=4868 RepID=A0ACC1JG89_9FUNG|nr:Replication factor C, subunit RFC4 [Linderina macrospora]
MSTSPKHQSRREELEALENVMIGDSLVALGAAVATTAALSVLGFKYSKWYRSTPISAKTAMILAPSIGAFYIRGEHASTAFRRQQYANTLEDQDEREQLLRQKMEMEKRASFSQTAISFVNEHRWSMLGYTWLAGISGSIFHLYRQKGMTWTQKVVQARMYAQLITIVGILSTAAVASLGDKKDQGHQQPISAALQAALAEDTKVPLPAEAVIAPSTVSK